MNKRQAKKKQKKLNKIAKSPFGRLQYIGFGYYLLGSGNWANHRKEYLPFPLNVERTAFL